MNSADVYRLGDLYLTCGRNAYKMMVYVSKNSMTNKRIECHVSSYQKSKGRQPFYESDCAQERSYEIESVAWIGEGLPSRGAEKNGFYFSLPLHGISRTHQQHGCDHFGPDEQMCEESKNDWSSSIMYYK